MFNMILTIQGLEKFKTELDQIRSTTLPATEERIRKAVEDGWENGDFDFDDAKAEHEFFKARAIKLEHCIKAAKWEEEKSFYRIPQPVGEDKPMKNQAILDVLNSLPVIERQGGDDPYILVANTQEVRERLAAAGDQSAALD